MMGKADNSYSAFDISAAGETIEISSSENVHGMKKIRRLTVEQVRALEKSFQLRMILEAGRKEELARALGLHPRQIAIWFQNRRAKWKTTQLEKDFGVLKQNYEFLKVRYRTLLEENKKLQSEIQRSNSIFKNVQNEKDKEVMGVGQIDFNIVKGKKEECYCVPNIPHQASVEEYCGQNVLLALQEEDCYYNMGEMSGFMLVDHWAPSFH